MNSEVANALAQRIISNPVSRSFFQRAVRIAFQDDPATVVVLTFSADGSLGLQQCHADDPSLDEVPVRLEFTPEALRSVSRGGSANDPPDITGSDEGLARQIMTVLGIDAGNTQLGGGGVGQQGGGFEMSRSMVFDAQLGPDRRIYNPFTARDPGPYDCRHWRVEAGVTSDGICYALSVGLTDPETPLRPPPTEQRNVSGVGHELILLTDQAGAAGDWHVGIVAAALREIGASERPFKDPDWVDYNRPLIRGGTCEGFLVRESSWLESPFPLDGGLWGRFMVMIAVTRDELDILNTQKEPRRLISLLKSEFGNFEISDPFRDPINLW